MRNFGLILIHFSIFIYFINRERQELSVFHSLMKHIPNFEARLLESSEEDVINMAEQVCLPTSSFILINLIIQQLQRGANGARSDDTKGIKGAIIDWITPKGQALNPHIPRNSKIVRGFHHERTGALLCPVDMDWSNLEYVWK